MPIYSFYFICSLLLCTTFASAQSLRIGFVDKDSIIVQSKAYKFSKIQVKAFGKTLHKILEAEQLKAAEYLQYVIDKSHRCCFCGTEPEDSEKKLQAMQASFMALAKQCEALLIEYEAFFSTQLEIQFQKSINHIVKTEGYDIILPLQSLVYPERISSYYDMESKILANLNAQFEEKEWQKTGIELLNKSKIELEQYKYISPSEIQKQQATDFLQYNPSFFYTYLTPLYYYSK